MDGDDDQAPACVEHVWRLGGVVFAPGGSWTEYGCERCGAVLPITPGQVHPETV